MAGPPPSPPPSPPPPWNSNGFDDYCGDAGESDCQALAQTWHVVGDFGTDGARFGGANHVVCDSSDGACITELGNAGWIASARAPQSFWKFNSGSYYSPPNMLQFFATDSSGVRRTLTISHSLPDAAPGESNHVLVAWSRGPFGTLSSCQVVLKSGAQVVATERLPANATIDENGDGYIHVDHIVYSSPSQGEVTLELQEQSGICWVAYVLSSQPLDDGGGLPPPSLLSLPPPSPPTGGGNGLSPDARRSLQAAPPGDGGCEEVTDADWIAPAERPSSFPAIPCGGGSDPYASCAGVRYDAPVTDEFKVARRYKLQVRGTDMAGNSNVDDHIIWRLSANLKFQKVEWAAPPQETCDVVGGGGLPRATLASTASRCPWPCGTLNLRHKSWATASTA